MSRSTLFVPLALAAAGAYAVTGAIGLVDEQGSPFTDTLDYVLEWFFVAALAATVGALLLVARDASNRAPRIGAGLAAAGNSALLVAATATAVKGAEALDPMFGIGILAIVAGYVTLTVADVRGALAPRGLGLVLLVGWFASIPVDVLTGAGGLALAAAWARAAHVATAREPGVGAPVSA
jgi:hypothetical protein